jgi:hypothetical protein
MNLAPLSQKVLKDELFMHSEDGYGETRMPVAVRVADIPDLHWLTDNIGNKFI